MISTVEMEEMDFNHIESNIQSEEKVVTEDIEKIIESECTREDNILAPSNEVIGLLDKLKNSFLSFCHGVRVKISHLEL